MWLNSFQVRDLCYKIEHSLKRKINRKIKISENCKSTEFLFYPLFPNIQYHSKVSYQSRLVSLKTSLVSRDSLKRQFWNKFQANCLARSRLQYYAKVMRMIFDEFRALFSSKYRRTFDRYFAAFLRQLNEISATVRQGKQKIESTNRFFQFSK